MDHEKHSKNPDTSDAEGAEDAEDTGRVRSASGVTPRRWDDRIIKTVSLVLVAVVVVFAVLNGEAAARAIGSFRTFVTGNFTWYFVVLATMALMFCI